MVPEAPKNNRRTSWPRSSPVMSWVFLRSYGYVCKGKNKATNAIRAVKTIAKARADRAAGRQVLVGDSVNYGLFCIQVLSQGYTKTTQCIQMFAPELVVYWRSLQVSSQDTILVWTGVEWDIMGPHADHTPFCEGKMKNIERFKQEIAIMKMMDWQGWTAGDTAGDRWPFRTQRGMTTPFGNQTWQQNIPRL